MQPSRAAGVGDVDGGWGVHGTIEKDYGGVDIAQAAVVDGAGRIVTVGWSVDTPDHAIVGRTLPVDPTNPADGTNELALRDPSFTPDAPYVMGEGFQMTSDIPWDGSSNPMATRFTDVAIDSSGRIVIVGTVQDGTAPAARQGLLVRLNPNGTLDTTFGGGTGGVIFDMYAGATDNQVQGVTVDQAGRILVAGAATVGGVQHAALARFVNPGALDSTFDPGLGDPGRFIDPSANTNAVYTDAVIKPSDLSIYAVGTGTNGSDVDTIITRVDTNGGFLGTSDEQFGDAGAADVATAAKLDNAGHLVVVGRTTQSGSTVGYITRFGTTPGMPLDTAWSGGGFSRNVNLAGAGRTSFEGLTIQPDGTYVIAAQLGTNSGGDTYDVGLYALTAATPPVIVPLGNQASTAGIRRNERTQRHLAAVSTNIRDIVTQQDGKVVVLGDHIHNVMMRFLTSPAQGTDAGSPMLAYSGDGIDDNIGISKVHKLVADTDQTWLAGEGSSNNFVVATQPAAGGPVTNRINGIPKPGGGGNFAVSQGNSVARGLDGAVVAAGSAGGGANSMSPAFVRFKADGSLDPTFGSGGVAVVPRTNPYDSADNMVDDAVVNDVAVLPDGKIVGVGFWQTPSGDPQDLFVVRLNPDGSLDPTFDGSGEYHGATSPSGATDDLDGVVVNPDGSFTAVGRQQPSVGTNEWAVVVRHYAANGNLLSAVQTAVDATAVPGGPNSMQVHGAAIGLDGRLYVVGDFGGCTNSSDRSAFTLAYKPDAQSLDATFGSSGLVQYCTDTFETGFGVAIAPNGDVVIAGGSGPSAQSPALTRYDSAGHPDMSFGVASAQTYAPPTSVNGDFETVAIRDDGTIVAAGQYIPSGSFNFSGVIGQVAGDPPPAPTDFGPTGRVVFDSTQSGHTDLWMADATGARLEQVTNQANQPGRKSADPTFNPDGREIAFTSISDTNAFDANIRKRNSSGVFVNLASDAAAYEADPDWSADGTKIAFTSDDNGPSYGNLGVQPFDIWTMNADGTGKTRITNTPDADQFPAWSADGSKILFQRSNGGAHDLWFHWMTGPSAGTNVKVTNGIDATHGSWGPNGEIVFTDATVHAPHTQVCYMLRNDASFTTFHEACSASAPGSNEDADFGVFVPTSDPARPATVQYTVGQPGGNRLDSINSTDGELRTIVSPGVGLIGTSDWVENLKVSTSTTAAAASPASIPVGYVPIQSGSSAIQSKFDGAGLPNLSLLTSGLPIITLLTSPLPNLSLLTSGLPIITLLTSPLPNLSLLTSGLPIITLLTSPVADGLKQTSLAEMRLERAGGWQQFNADIPELASVPAQSLTLYDELKALQAHPSHGTFTLQELSYQGTPFGQISAAALTLAKMPVSSITKQGVDFCSYVHARAQAFASFSCSQIGALSMLDLQVAGVDFSGLTNLEGLKVGDLSYPSTAGATGRPALADFHLADMQLDLMNLGTVPLSTTPNRSAITTCSTCATLADAFSAHAIKSTAVFSDLGHAADEFTIGELVTGFLPTSYSPIDKLPADQLGIEGYNGTGANESSKLSYAVDYTPDSGASNEPLSGLAFTVDLPAGFHYIAGSGAISVNGVSIGTIHPTRLSGNRVEFALPRTVHGTDLLHVGFDVRPGLDLAADQTVGVRVGSHVIDQQVHNRAAVDVQDIFEPANDTIASAPAIDPDRLYLNHSQTGTDVDFSTLNAPGGGSTLTAGTTVTMILTQGGGDADLVVYGPAGLSAGQALRRTNPNTTPVVPVGDPGSLRNSGEPLDPEMLNDVAIANLPVVGISTNRGVTNDVVTFTAPITGVYRAEVIPFNHLPSPKTQTLRFTATPPSTPAACTGRSGYSAGLASRPTPTPASVAGKTSLFLVNSGRLAASYGQSAVDAMTAKLNTLAARSEVNGAVVDLDGFSAVRAAYATWDADSCSPDAANAVVRAINDAVDSLYGADGLASSSVDNVVLVGNDEMLPMARVPDLTQQASERGYGAALAFTGSNNALQAAFNGGYQLSDEPYGDKAPSPYLGRYLYVSDVGLSRLGETPTDITAYAQSYIDANGQLDRASALTAGYDFMRDLATDVDSTLGRSVPSSGKTLLDDDASTSAAPFTRANTASALDANPDIVSLDAHYDHSSLLPGVSSGSGTQADLYNTAAFDQSSASDRSRSLFFTMGCHSGVSVADILIANPNAAQATRLRDWAQAMAAHKATYIGQTGYGVGLKYTVGLSEKILSDFARNLTTTGTSVGDALRLSKQHYVGSIGVYGVYDEKVLSEAVLYGLPFWKLPGGVAATVPHANPATHVDPFTGLDSFGFAADPAFTTHDTGADGKFLTASQDDAVSTDPLTVIGRPLEPKLELDVTQPGKQIAGGLITELTSDDSLTSFNPVVAHQVVDDSSHEPEIDSSDVLFPATVVSSSEYLDRSGPRHSVVVVPGQFKATGSQSDGQTIGVQRRYTHVAGLAYYSSSADRIRPVIAKSSVSRVGQAVAFDVIASDQEPGPTPESPLPGGIKRVVVLAHDETTATWERAEMTPDPTDPTHFTGGLNLTGDTVEYLVQAVDNNGNVGASTNKNFFASPAVAPPAPAGITATAGGPATPDAGSGWTTDATITLSGPVGVTFEYLVDGEGANGSTAAIPYGGPFHITTEGSHRVDWTASNGKSGYLLANVDTAAPTVTILSPTDGARVQAGSQITPAYRCDDTGAGIQSCDVTAGGSETAVDTSSPNADTTKTFRVRATDNAGRTATGSVTFVADGTAPVITLNTPKADGSSEFVQGSDPVEDVTCTDGGQPLACVVPTINTATAALSRNYSVTATDAVGNSTTASTHYAVSPGTPPTITITTPTAGQRFKAGSSVAPVFHCDDVGWGVASCKVTDGGSATALDTTSPGADTTKTFTVETTDNRGQKATQSVSFVADGTAPVITMLNPAADGSSKFETGANEVESVTCTDGGQPLACTVPTINTATPTPSRPYSVTATDSVGNSTTVSTHYAVLDAAAPHIVVTTPASGQRFKDGAAVTPVFNCEDVGWGVASCDVTSGGSATALDTSSPGADTTKTFTVKATDTKGRVSTLAIDYVADGTAPVVTLVNPAADGTSKFETGSNPAENVTCTDGGQAIACTVPQIDTSTPAASRTYSVTATDAVGNSATATTHYAVADATLPGVTITTPAPGQQFRAGASVTPAFACSDTGWGVASCVVTAGGSATALDTVSPNADTTKTFKVTATDSAGRTRTASVSYVVDGTAPTITLTNPKADGTSVYATGVAATPSVTCSDGGVVIACALPAIDTSSATPSRDYFVTATDSVGNVTTVVTHYAVANPTGRFEGWFAPVVNRPAYNTVSVLSTTPMRFRVYDRFDALVTDPSVVRSAAHSTIACPGLVSGASISINIPPSSGTTSWSAANNRFEYPFVAQVGWLLSCQRFSMTFDPSLLIPTQSADFKFTV